MRPALDPDRVRAAIETAERRTSAEIVVAVAPFFLGGVARAARRAFDRLGVARTRARNGVLVFVVPARHQVVVLPDAEADTRVAPAVWTAAAERVTAGFRRHHPTDGVVDAITGLGDELAAPFPPLPGDIDELPDLPLSVAPASSRTRRIR